MSSTRRPPAGRDGEGSRAGEESPADQPPAPEDGKGRRGSDLLARVAVAVPAAALAIGFTYLGGLPFTLFMLAIGLVCQHELYRLLARWRPIPIVGFAALTAMVLVAHYEHRSDILLVAMAALPVLFVAALVRGHGGMTVAMAGTLLGIYWLGFAFAQVILLRALPHGGGVTIDVLVGTFLGDTGAYAGGRLIGRRPLAPQVSPKKTVEGLLCGMLVTIAAVFVMGLFQHWLTHGDALALGFAIAVLGPLGDLFESVIKRDAQTKDAGHVFGAHGGALDRLDAVIFTVVAAYWIWLALGR